MNHTVDARPERLQCTYLQYRERSARMRPLKYGMGGNIRSWRSRYCRGGKVFVYLRMIRLLVYAIAAVVVFGLADVHIFTDLGVPHA